MLKPPSGNCRARMDSHRFVDQRPRGRIPHAVRPADAATAAAECNPIRAWCRRSDPPTSILAGAAVRSKKSSARCAALATSWTAVRRRLGGWDSYAGDGSATERDRSNSEGRLKRTSSSLISISSSSSKPHWPRSDSINSWTRFSGAEAPAVTATVSTPSSHSGFTSLNRRSDRPERLLFANFHQPPRIRAVLRTHHQQHLAQRHHCLDRQLPVFRRIANILRRRALESSGTAAAAASRCLWSHPGSGGLGDVGDSCGSFTSSRSTSSTVETRTVASGASPSVPITSS